MTAGTSSDSYRVPTARQHFEFEIKASRFITTVARVECKLEARNFIATLNQQYADANHNCWAMVAGQPSDVGQQDQSDDGEPKGTAGMPMLYALQCSGFGNIVVVVTRYFGGVKLGAAGLVRAYSRAVSEALTQIDTDVRYVCISARINLPYSELDKFLYWLQTTRIKLTQKEFTDEVYLEADVPLQDAELLDKFIGSNRLMSLNWPNNIPGK